MGSSVHYLKHLSGELNLELQTAIFQPKLTATGHCFFPKLHEVSPSGMKELCIGALSIKEVAKKDTLFRAGDSSNQMLLPSTGSLVYDFKKTRVRLYVRQYCCEHAL